MFLHRFWLPTRLTNQDCCLCFVCVFSNSIFLIFVGRMLTISGYTHLGNHWFCLGKPMFLTNSTISCLNQKSIEIIWFWIKYYVKNHHKIIKNTFLKSSCFLISVLTKFASILGGLGHPFWTHFPTWDPSWSHVGCSWCHLGPFWGPVM